MAVTYRLYHRFDPLGPADPRFASVADVEAGLVARLKARARRRAHELQVEYGGGGDGGSSRSKI